MSEVIYTLSDISMKSSPFDKITDLRLHRQVNEHVKLSIGGIIPEDKLDQYVEQIDENEIIEVFVTQDKREITLFKGVITNIAVQVDRNVRTMIIEASSKTFLMDIKKENRSFQNSQQSYSDVFSVITQSYPQADVVDASSNGALIGGLLVQYRETSWEFAKRLASHFHMPLLPISTLEGIKYYVGLPESGQPVELNEYNYTIKNNMKEFKQITENSGGQFAGQSNFSFEVTSNRVLEIGCPVKFHDHELYVYRAEIAIEKGILINHYQLRDREGFHCHMQYNNAIIGSSLFGKITDIAKDKVKLHLQIDDNHSTSKAMWFSYSTVYSSPDGSGWYCMPEIGDEVRLYFPDAQEKNAFAASSVDLDSSDTTKRSDPAVKSISTKYGKQIVFQPGAVEIIGNGQTLLRLTDDGGIEIKSDKKIVITAVDDIEITGGAKVLIQGDEGVDLKQADTMLTIQDEVALTGSKVNIR
ncbi:phage tail protein [Paenibacillus glacialis]|uniref:Phage tail protein n=1 Tax=Paenibacillus glacialis TaxID=494026 RepID=A0A162KEU6_9BACL|nr:phage tail protein [Paenibacillus glacialis]OAB45498.1 phage tail protein [Paenibacillus glacialis]